MMIFIANRVIIGEFYPGSGSGQVLEKNNK